MQFFVNLLVSIEAFEDSKKLFESGPIVVQRVDDAFDLLHLTGGLSLDDGKHCHAGQHNNGAENSLIVRHWWIVAESNCGESGRQVVSQNNNSFFAVLLQLVVDEVWLILADLIYL